MGAYNICVIVKDDSMQRYIKQQLIEWKNSYNRKPLILRGARQVGKTYIKRVWRRTI